MQCSVQILNAEWPHNGGKTPSSQRTKTKEAKRTSTAASGATGRTVGSKRPILPVVAKKNQAAASGDAEKGKEPTTDDLDKDNNPSDIIELLRNGGKTSKQPSQ